MGTQVVTAVKAALNWLIDPPREWWKRAVNLTRGIQDINVLQAQTLIQQGAFVLDVREPDEFEAGHLPASTLIPLAQLPDRVAEIEAYRSHNIVVICHGGKRSATACGQLAQLGFGSTYNIAGGILAWKKAKLPMVE
ncbi:rhodanese-like domain-containing protein [Rhodoferax sp. BLA1]|uniref:rhodanese-like domain-containing protein n=1 Tax=Rhodoferax sp. BLA1 TaxID=2576062 RepID=UPI0015D451A5|nr:rhodanese-like domain-containing protein [Rhodoferax sp. BLA1]